MGRACGRVAGEWLMAPLFGVQRLRSEYDVDVSNCGFPNRFLKLFLHRVKAGKPFRQTHLVCDLPANWLQSIEADWTLVAARQTMSAP
jgi:hypothetical protein